MANSSRRILSSTYVSPTTLSAIGIWSLKEQLQASNINSWPLAITAGPSAVEYLIAGGGGAGGGGSASNGRGGGGGAGGVVYGSLDTSINKQINIVVGSGGAAVSGSLKGNSGTGTSISTAFSGNVTAAVFSGSNNLSFAKSGTNWDLGTGDFTIECWVNPSNFTALQYIAAQGNVSTTANWALAINTSGQFVYYLSSAATTFNIASAVVGGTLALNTWSHVALVRTGSTFTPYVNGIAGTTTTSALTIFTSTDALYLGTTGALANRFTGYLTNFRMVKGLGVYTAPFIPPTTYFSLTQAANINGFPSKAITTQTVMLTLQSSPATDLAYGTALTNTASVTYTTSSAYTPISGNIALGGGGGGAYTTGLGYSGGSGGGGGADSGIAGATTQVSTYGYGFGNQGGVGSVYANTTATGAGGGGGAGVTGTNASITSTTTTLGSIYFNGTSQYLTTPSNITLGSGNFTVEFWLYTSALPSVAARPLSQGTYATGEFLFTVNANGSFDWCTSTTPVISAAAGTIVAGTWQHIVITRNGTSMVAYVNGTAKGATTSSYNFTGTTAVYIGGNPTTTAQYYNGYISDLRIISGSSEYIYGNTTGTTYFSYPTTNLSAVTNTALLLNVSSSSAYLTDSSTNNYTITNTGSAPYVFYTPYTNTTTITNIDAGTGGASVVGTGKDGNIIGAGGQGGLGNSNYSNWLQATSTGQAIVKGGGIAFAGLNGQYLLVRHGTALNVPAAAPTGTDFTIECWVYLNAHTASSPCVFGNHSSSGDGALALFAGHGSILFGNTGTSTTKWGVYTPNVGTWTILGNSGSGTNIVYNTWHHLAIVRQGSGTNNAKFYLNGALEAQITWAMFLGPVGVTTWWISASGDGTNGTSLNGIVSNFRVTGSAVYTGPFTPPTSALNLVQSSGTNISAITDTSNTSYSVQFSGTNQYIYTTNYQYNLIGDFTVEGWFYPTSFATAMNLFDTLAIGGAAARTAAFAIRTVVTTGVVGIFTNSVLSTTTSTGLTVNTWNHVAVVRIGSTIKIYINGTALATITNSTTFTSNGLTIGTNADAVTGSAGFVGYISNVRVVNGLGVYVGNFTTPTNALTTTQTSQGRNILSIASGQTVFLGLQSSAHTDVANSFSSLTAVNVSLPTTTVTPFRSIVKFLMNSSDIIDYSTNAIPISIGAGGATKTTSSPFASPTTSYFIGGGGSGSGGIYQTTGGAGGGGAGGGISDTGAAGLTNTGGGGGGGGGFTGAAASSGAGGSGLAIVRYPSGFADAAATTGSPTGPIVSGGYKYYAFTGSGSLTLSTMNIPAEYLVVAGGGAGGFTGNGGSGGGGGGLLTGSSSTLLINNTTITVGAGGAAVAAVKAANGSDSIISGLSTIQATGGGGGNTRDGGGTGSAGGSGGGGSNTAGGGALGGTGVSGQGYAGGTGGVDNSNPPITYASAGGGGAGGAGTSATSQFRSGHGGIGAISTIGGTFAGTGNTLVDSKGLFVTSTTAAPCAVGTVIAGSGIRAATSLNITSITQSASVVTVNFATQATVPFAPGTLIKLAGTSGGTSDGQWVTLTGTTSSVTFSSNLVAAGAVGTISAPATYIVYGPAVFQATFSGTTMTVISVTSGVVNVGQVISGSGITAGTTITAQASATTWTISVSHTIGTSTTITASHVMSQAATATATGTALTSVGTYYAGGGGGSQWAAGEIAGRGGAGGGGDAVSQTYATSAPANTGGGGPGGGAGALGTNYSGGSGIVILAYPTAYPDISAISSTLTCNGTTGTVTADLVSRPGYKVYRFTAGTGQIRWY